ncbi:MAG: GntR family transcriptional regulator [Dehalococcoidales bacterium]|nr:GntR family transcriptional regulator [Dehalococcoidales bacterium]
MIPPIGERYRTLSQHAYDVILEAILDGRIRSNQRLVLDELATQLRVSQTPVRDALARLASEGLVEMTGRRGFRVTVVTPEDLANLYDLGLMCELYAMDKGLARLTTALMAEIERLAEESARIDGVVHNEDRSSFIRVDREFHSRIVSIGENPKLVDLYLRLNMAVQVTRVGSRRITPLEQRRANAPEHMAIVAALKNRDASAAKEAIRAHSEKGLRRGLARIQEELQPSEPALASSNTAAVLPS